MTKARQKKLIDPKNIDWPPADRTPLRQWLRENGMLPPERPTTDPKTPAAEGDTHGNQAR